MDRLAGLELEVEGLIEARSGGGRDFSRYRGPDGKIAFFREELGFEPFEYQERIARAVVEHRRVVVRGAHSVGKERVAGAEALYAAIVEGKLVLLLSATARQVLGQTMREVRKLWTSNASLPGEIYSATLRLQGEDRILAFAGSSVDSLTGWHDPAGVLVIISEGQGERLEDIAYDAALTNATDDLSRVLILGNPVRPTGRFYQASRSSNWHSIRVPVTDHPNIREGRMVIPGGPSPDWPAEMAAEYGEDSPFYVSRVLAEFPESSVDSLVKRSWLEASAKAWEGWRQWHTGDGGSSLTVAADVARLGGDRSVVAAVRGDVLAELFRIPAVDTMQTVGRILQEVTRLELGASYPGRDPYPRNGLRALGTEAESPGRKQARLLIDSAGLGAGIVDRLVEQGQDVVSFNSSFSPQGQEGARYLNLRAEAYFNLRSRLEGGTAVVPQHPDLWEELLATEWTIHSSGKVQIVPKSQIQTSIGRSPDFADAVAMAFWGGKEGPSVGFSTLAM